MPIDLRNADIADVLPSVTDVALTHADPPWKYSSRGAPRGGEDGMAGGPSYPGLRIPEIGRHVREAHDCAQRDSYLLMWCTNPILGEWMTFAQPKMIGWRYLTAGTWGKTGRLGVGFHLRGDNELLLVYGKGAPRPHARNLSGLYLAPREEHSVKPTTWLRRLLVEFARPTGPVLDLYAGSAPLAAACIAAGRDYVGAEIDPDTHAAAQAKLARVVFARGAA